MFRKADPKETIRNARRGIQKSSRDVEKELQNLKREEQKLIGQIKACARQGNDASTRIMAKSLIRIRQQITKLTAGNAHLKTVSTQMTTVGAQHSMVSALQKSSEAMKEVGKAIQPEKLQQTLAQFMQENAKLDMTQDLMEDAFDNDDVESEADDVMNQVLDEIGIDLSSQLSKAPAPKTQIAAPSRPVAEPKYDEEEEDLLRRLGALKN